MDSRQRRFLAIAGLVGVLVAAAAVVCVTVGPRWFAPDAAPITAAPVAGEATAGAPEEPAAPIAGPFYLQGDPRWGDDAIGGSGEKLRAVGCTLCCLSMALGHLGEEVDPGELNRRLKAQGGYTARGLLDWDAVPRVTAGRFRVRTPARPTHEEIGAALASGSPVLAKILLGGRIPHWVLIVESAGGEYRVKDPLSDGRALTPLGAYGSDIQSIRYVVR
jgi:hypothetical protein